MYSFLKVERERETERHKIWGGEEYLNFSEFEAILARFEWGLTERQAPRTHPV